MLNIYGLHPDALIADLLPHFPAYRSKQLLDWLYKHLQDPLENKVNLPADMKLYLKEHYSFALPAVDSKLISSDKSQKFRFLLEDKAAIEGVLIPEKTKHTLCVSSQVGCARACAFCATGTMGLKRNLEVHEIVGQIIIAMRECLPERLTNIVFMGMGEPLDNLDNVLQALALIQAEQSLAFSPRRTTISTCGIVPEIRKLADSGVRVKLAVSLNSAIDAKRDTLMPINRRYPLNILKQALLYYARKCAFRITFEYILIPEVNMGKEDLQALRKFVGDLPCKINFIPYNPVSGLSYTAPTEDHLNYFMNQAASLPQAIMLRRSRGLDVFGACGQLRSHTKEEKHA